jgi:hypothetical protein
MEEIGREPNKYRLTDHPRLHGSASLWFENEMRVLALAAAAPQKV